MIATLFRWLMLWSVLLTCTHAAAVDVPVGAERLPLGRSLEYLFTPAERGSAEAMRDGGYRPADGEGLAFGFRSEALWVRMTLHNPAPAAIERVLQIEPVRLEEVSLFVPEAGGAYRRLDNGMHVALAGRPVPTHAIAFPLHLEPGASTTLYLRVHTRTILSLRPVLWTPAAFAAAMARESLFDMLSIGALLGLSIYAILTFPLRRDWAALWLGLTMLVSCLSEAVWNGYDLAYLWPGQLEWTLRAVPVLPLLVQMGFNRFFSVLIPLSAFGWVNARRWLDGLLLADAVLLVAILLSPQPDRHLIAVLILLLVAAVLLSFLGISLAALRKGYRPAAYAIAGILFLAFTIAAPRLGESMGWPMPAVSFAPPLFVTTLLFFASISQRVDLLRREKAATLAETLAGQQRIAARLEAQVAERTLGLQAAKERAERADMAKGEFLARVSHELRTPLHTILGYADLLRRDVADSRSSEHLSMVEESSHHLAKLVDELLDYARGERGGLLLRVEAAFLYRLLERLRKQGAILCDPRRHRFECRFIDNLPRLVRVDALRLEQVLLILLSNAIRYTAAGRIILSVEACAAGAGRTRLRFAVEDTGPGIAESDRERIFDPFERIPGADHTGGLGLGLAIGRQIVRAMGGELRVDSRLGEGSRFCFDVELDLAVEEDVPLLLPDLDITGYAGPARKILLVEDCAANLDLLEQVLVELGFMVHVADGMGKGLELLAVESFDLALLDQRLPDGTGWDILRVLHRLASPIPAVLLSAQPPLPPKDWGSLPGFDAVLLKPVNGADVLQCIGGLLGLVWLRAGKTAGLPRPGRGCAAMPSAAECATLATLAQQGAVYELEEWLARVRLLQPECAAFCDEVGERLSALDLAGIAGSARAAAAFHITDQPAL